MMQVNESYYRIVLWSDTNADLGQCLINELIAELNFGTGDLAGFATHKSNAALPTEVLQIRASEISLC